MSGAVITPDSRLGELTEAYPGVRRALFRNYHIGGCSQCAYSDDETLRELCERNDGLDVAEVVATLRDAEAEDRRFLIEPGELKALMDAGRTPGLLDVRSREEFEAFHIPGSRFFTQDFLREILADWDRGAPVVVIDHTGARGPDAAAFLAGHGFTDVKALRGGIDAYASEADPGIPRYEIEME